MNLTRANFHVLFLVLCLFLTALKAQDDNVYLIVRADDMGIITLEIS